MGPAINKNRVLITRCPEDFEETRQLAETFGLTALSFPLLKRQPLTIAEPPAHDWALFTSPAAVRLWPYPTPPGKLLACVGAPTARAAEERGWPVAFVPGRATGTDLARELPAPPGSSVALPVSVRGGAPVTRGLEGRGILVTRVNLYETRATAPSPEALALVGQGFEAVLFASPTATRAWAEYLPGGSLKKKLILSIGPSTTTACGALGWGPILEGVSGDLEDLFQKYASRS